MDQLKLKILFFSKNSCFSFSVGSKHINKLNLDVIDYKGERNRNDLKEIGPIILKIDSHSEL